jgi:hypothetical protein
MAIFPPPVSIFFSMCEECRAGVGRVEHMEDRSSEAFRRINKIKH